MLYYFILSTELVYIEQQLIFEVLKIFENFWNFQKFHLWVDEIFSILVKKIRYLKFFFWSKKYNQKPFERTKFHQKPTFSLKSQPCWNIAYLTIFSVFLKKCQKYIKICYISTGLRLMRKCRILMKFCALERLLLDPLKNKKKINFSPIFLIFSLLMLKCQNLAKIDLFLPVSAFLPVPAFFKIFLYIFRKKSQLQNESSTSF